MLGANGYVTPEWAIWFTQMQGALTSRQFYVPVSDGAPTFTPEERGGFVPMAYDTANNRIYVYNGAWKLVALA